MRPLLSMLIAFAFSFAAIAVAPAQAPPVQKKGPPPAAAPAPKQQQAPAPKQQQGPAPQQPQAPQAAPVKPYQQLTVKLAPQTPDPSLDAFRKQLGEAAAKKDRAALGRMVVAQGFFWENASGDKIDKKKNSVQNFAAALKLDVRDSGGWESLESAAQEPTVEPVPDRKGVVCGPAGPQFDDKAFDDVLQATQTDPAEWAFATGAKIDVREAGRANAPVSESLGAILIRILAPDQAPAAANPQDVPFMRVATPSGKTGFVSLDSIAPLAFDQLCYVKDASGWKITGYFGGE